MKLLTVKQTIEKIGLSKRAIYDRMDKSSPRYDETFPTPIKLGDSKNSSIRFLEIELDDWIKSLMLIRNN